MIKKMFVSIWLFFEKIIIIPITRLIISITKRFDKSGKKLERWLSKSNTLLFISLFFAIVLFIAIDQKIITFAENSAEVLKKQEVKVIYNEEAYVIDGIPQFVDITLIGKRAELMFAKQSAVHDVSVDLTGLKPGTHKVNITYKQAMQSIDYKVNPSVATVVIYPKVSEMRTLMVDLLNQDSLSEKLVIDNVIVPEEKVVIKGPEYKLKEVATVKALIDIKNLLKQEEGVALMKDVSLKAYNNEGEVINIEIVPEKVNAELKISSPNKELHLKVVPVGTMAFGKAISSIVLSETNVSVYGEEEALNNLNYIPLEIDVNNLRENRKYKMEIKKPVGVKYLSTTNVTIDVYVDNSVDRELSDIQIEYRNLNDIYSVQGLSKEDVSVVVGLKGVASLIEGIQSSDVVAYLDLKGYGEGEHEVAVQIEGNDPKIQYIAKTKKVRIKIIKAN